MFSLKLQLINHLFSRCVLAIFHAIYCVSSPIQFYILLTTIKRANSARAHKEETDTFWCLMRMFILYVIQHVFNPIVVGLVLYGEHTIGGNSGVRVAIATSIITTSYLYLRSISRFPCVGRYTNMLTKVSFKCRLPVTIIFQITSC